MNAVTKTAKFAIIVKTIDKIYEIYSRGSKEGPSKVTKTAKFMKFTKTAKFAIIVKTTDKIYQIYSRGSKAGPSKVSKTAKIT